MVSPQKTLFYHSVLFLSYLIRPIRCNVNPELGWKTGWKPASSSLTDALSVKGMANLLGPDTTHWGNGCSMRTAAKRREW
jgi:hypothetical protein